MKLLWLSAAFAISAVSLSSVTIATAQAAAPTAAINVLPGNVELHDARFNRHVDRYRHVHASELQTSCSFAGPLQAERMPGMKVAASGSTILRRLSM